MSLKKRRRQPNAAVSRASFSPGSEYKAWSVTWSRRLLWLRFSFGIARSCTIGARDGDFAGGRSPAFRDYKQNPAGLSPAGFVFFLLRGGGNLTPLCAVLIVHAAGRSAATGRTRSQFASG